MEFKLRCARPRRCTGMVVYNVEAICLPFILEAAAVQGLDAEMGDRRRHALARLVRRIPDIRIIIMPQR